MARIVIVLEDNATGGGVTIDVEGDVFEDAPGATPTEAQYAYATLMGGLAPELVITKKPFRRDLN